MEFDPLHVRGLDERQVLALSEVVGLERMTPCGLHEAEIDFEVLFTRTDWSQAEIYARREQAEKCEILVPDFIEIELILNMPNG